MHAGGAGIVRISVGALRPLVCLTCVALACSGSDLTDRLYKSGQRAERAGDALQAYLFYARAAALEPANVNYAMRKAALQARAAISAAIGARSSTDHPRKANPTKRPRPIRIPNRLIVQHSDNNTSMSAVER